MFAAPLPRQEARPAPVAPGRLMPTPGFAGPRGMHDLSREGGAPLDPASLAHFQSSFGHDLSGVRVHSGDRAAASAVALSARAYTVGRHVVFGPGEHRPHTAAGRQVLAHELAHVVQQGRGGSTPAESSALEASAERAAAGAARGERTIVAGSSAPGVARLAADGPLAGRSWYSWLLVKSMLEGDGQVEDVVALVNTPTDRDQAIEDISRERAIQASRMADPAADIDARWAAGRFVERADQVLQTLFAAVARVDSPDQLDESQPTQASRQTVEEALKPDLAGTGATAGPFQEEVGGKSYADNLRAAILAVIDDLYVAVAEPRTEAAHADPKQVYPLAEIERIANASKRETDHLFGGFAAAGPDFKADGPEGGGNLHDAWQINQDENEGSKSGDKRSKAREFVFYLFQSSRQIAAVNRAHNADPQFAKSGNEEGKQQQEVADEIVRIPKVLERLLEIDRGWDAVTDSSGVNVQIFRPARVPVPMFDPYRTDRTAMWDFFQTCIHEYLHTLPHPQYELYVEALGNESAAANTLDEGVVSLLTEIVWSNVAPRTGTEPLRMEVEGPYYNPDFAPDIPDIQDQRYDSYDEAVELVSLVGIHNLYAAYFLGHVDKIAGQKK